MRKARGNDTIDLTVELRSDPEFHRAYLLFDGTRELWVPKSLCEIEPDDNGKTYTLTVQRWYAEKEGLV